MTESSPINSPFNGFLFSAIGEDKNAMSVSVLSALARVDVDPWDEAARLSRLPKEQAAQSLASIIEGLRGGKWAPTDCKKNAARLVELLPAQNCPRFPPVAVNIDRRVMVLSQALMWLILGAMWGVVLLSGSHTPATTMGQTDTRVFNATSPPEVTLLGSD